MTRRDDNDDEIDVDGEPPVDGDPDEDDDDDQNDDDGGGAVERISQRLARTHRGVRFTAQGSGDAVPGQAADIEKSLERAMQLYDVNFTEPYIVYVGSAEDRPGSLREHAAKNNLSVVMVDTKIGGYEHDLNFAPVVADLEIVIRHASCLPWSWWWLDVSHAAAALRTSSSPSRGRGQRDR